MEQSNADKILNGVVTSVNQKFSADRAQMETSMAERKCHFSESRTEESRFGAITTTFRNVAKNQVQIFL